MAIKIKTRQELIHENQALKEKIGQLRIRLNKELTNTVNYGRLVEQNQSLQQDAKNYRDALINVFSCLIKENQHGGAIQDTIWMGNFTTLFDYIALTLGIENINEFEKKVLNKEKQA